MKKFLMRFISRQERGIFSSGPKEREDEIRLSGQDMTAVMEVMGFSYREEEGVCERELEGMFEVEPSVEEMKEAFSFFDSKSDGFIDAEELFVVLRKLGFQEASSLERCRRMIDAYDIDNDGKVNFAEFVMCLESSFSCH